MTARAILAALVEDPTESQLSDILEDSSGITWIPDPLNNLNAIGYALVVTDDGLLAIPYTAVFLGDGWEQLDLDEAMLMPLPASYSQAAAAYRQAEHNLVALLEASLDQAHAAPL